MKKIIRVRPKRLSVSNPIYEKKELLYNKDFFKWTKTQASLLKKGNINELDIENLIEEIESLGRNDKRALRSHVVVLLMHLLKQKYQPNKQVNSTSWQRSILNSTREINILIKDSPSLKNELVKIFPEAYQDARQDAFIETGLPIDTFPKESPWSLEEALNEAIKVFSDQTEEKKGKNKKQKKDHNKPD